MPLLLISVYLDKKTEFLTLIQVRSQNSKSRLLLYACTEKTRM